MPNNERFPLQPVYLTQSRGARFRPNRIVWMLLDEGPFDMNQLAVLAARGDFTDAEREQFAMLIGYSVGGFGELSYVSDAAYNEARERADELLKESDHAQTQARTRCAEDSEGDTAVRCKSPARLQIHVGVRACALGAVDADSWCVCRLGKAVFGTQARRPCAAGGVRDG